MARANGTSERFIVNDLILSNQAEKKRNKQKKKPKIHFQALNNQDWTTFQVISCAFRLQLFYFTTRLA